MMLVCQNASEVDNGSARALDRALPTGQADAFFDMRQVLRHGDGPGGTRLFAQAAADAGNLAVFAGVFAQVFVGALDDDGVRALVNVDELARAFAHAFAAGDALVLVDLGHAVVVEGDGLKFARVHAQLAADAAVLAVGRRAAAAAAGGVGHLF